MSTHEKNFTSQYQHRDDQHLQNGVSILHRFRSVATFILAIIITGLASLAVLVETFLLRLPPQTVQKIPQFHGKILCWAAGVKVKVSGQENIRKGQTYIYAANHCSQFDIIAFQGYFPYIFSWMAKKELFAIPIFGAALTHIGYIPIDRSKGRKALKSLKKAAELIAQGRSVIIFPEGTRSVDGRLTEFKSGAALLAILAQTPVIPIGFNGTFEVMPKKNFFPKSGEVEIRIGEPISVVSMTSKDKKELLQQIQQGVKAQLDSRYHR